MTARPDVAELAELTGGAARPGEPQDAVGGFVPGAVVRPATEDQVAAVLRAAGRRCWAVSVRGSGTKLGWGARPDRCDVVLETAGLDRLTEHEPGDLICIAGAGMTLGSLQALVSAAPGYRQSLMLDPPQGPRSTLGGLVATRACGPLRTRYGTMRDLLLGARFVLADGTVAKTGGKVVKNVAGYDLDKLLVGSLGSLAVVVEVALRLHPVPAASRTVLVEVVDGVEAAGFCSSLRRAPAAPSLVEVLWPERQVVVRVDSSEEGSLRQAERISALSPRARILDEGGAQLMGERLRDRPWQGPGPVLGFAIPLSALAGALERADQEFSTGSMSELSLRGTLGVGEVRLAEDAEAVARWIRGVEGLGGHLTVHRADPALGGLGSPVADPVGRQLMAAVKRAFDPLGVLAPGPVQGDG